MRYYRHKESNIIYKVANDYTWWVMISDPDNKIREDIISSLRLDDVVDCSDTTEVVRRILEDETKYTKITNEEEIFIEVL